MKRFEYTTRDGEEKYVDVNLTSVAITVVAVISAIIRLVASM